jgi:hypothetical protein
VVPSIFLFDERLFDTEYFRERMRASRENKRRKREETRRILAESRSPAVGLNEMPSSQELSELHSALDDFVASEWAQTKTQDIDESSFRMDDYREMILDIIDECCILFSAIPRISESLRLDRVRRFITLVYMQQEKEVNLFQQSEDLLVAKYEADIEG